MEPIDETRHPLADPAILAALEARPHVVPPPGFAARMARLAQAEPVRRPMPRPRYGEKVAWISLIVLAIAILALSPVTFATGTLNPSPLVLLQCILIAQLLTLALWLGLRAFPGAK